MSSEIWPTLSPISKVGIAAKESFLLYSTSSHLCDRVPGGGNERVEGAVRGWEVACMG